MLPRSCVRMLLVLAICCGVSGLDAAPPGRQLLLKMPPVSGVRSVAVSPDETLIATDGGDGGGVLVYDAATGELLRSIDRLGDNTVVFSPDSRYLAAAGFRMDGSRYDESIHLCDVRTGKVVRTFAGHTEIESYSIAFSPDGRLLASGGKDKQILVWDVATGELKHRFADQAFPISALAFAPDSNTLASGGGDRTVRLWDIRSGTLIRSLKGHGDWISDIAFSRDGSQIASASCNWGYHRGHDWPLQAGSKLEKSQWKVWNARTGDLKRSVTQPGRLLSLAFTLDGRSIVCGLDKEVRLYDAVQEGPPRLVSTHSGLVTSVAVSRDGTSIFSSSHDHTVQRVRLSDGKLERRLPGLREQVNAVSLSQDASLLAAASGDMHYVRGLVTADTPGLSPGAIRLWNLRTGRLLHRMGDPAEQYFATAVSRDGRMIAGGGGLADGTGIVRVWDATSGTQVWSQHDHAAEVLAVAIMPDGKLLASGGTEGTVYLRDMRTGTVTSALKGHVGGATSLAFSPDGSWLLCGAGSGAVQIWEVHTGKLLRSCRVEGSPAVIGAGDRVFNCIGLSHDGGTLAASRVSVWNQFGEPVRIWDPRSGSLLRDFSVEKIQGRPMALAPDGTIVATGGKTISLYDVRTGKRLRELFGHLKRTQSMAFSPDGRLLVSGGNYGTINAWEVATGRHLITLFTFAQTHSGRGSDEWLAYTPDGYYEGSAAVDRYLSWRVGDELQTPATPGLQFRRPDRVEAALNPPPGAAASP